MTKTIKRKIKRRKKGKSNVYFSMKTQESISKFQSTEERAEKHKIYVKEILPAYDKLVQNLIFIYGFAAPNEPFEVLKNDCIAHLYETIHKWDESKGTKAFSYFNVVAKNWLIGNAKKKQNKNKRHISVDDIGSISKADAHKIASYKIEASPDEIKIMKGFRNEIMDILSEIKKTTRVENEALCIDAVITIFKSMDNLEFLNKRAIFVYIREISGLTPKQLSVAMGSIRKSYRKITKNRDFFEYFGG